jgi:hypothetical protein
MSNCIKCANCGAVSFYEGGKTKIHCITCYNTLRTENERLREALKEIIALDDGNSILKYYERYYQVFRLAKQALNEVTK